MGVRQFDLTAKNMSEMTKMNLAPHVKAKVDCGSPDRNKCLTQNLLKSAEARRKQRTNVIQIQSIPLQN